MKRKIELLNEEIVVAINNVKDIVNGDKWALKYHIMPKIGWLNDPNGLCYFKGEYHVFYQYSPLDARGGLKFWAHYKSKNLLRWDDLGIALYPDSEFDRDGVYSGSALVEGDELYLFYTGNVKEEGNHDYVLTGRQQNVICVKSLDGINFGEKKVVLTNKDFPENFTLHVRDPKVWKENNNYYMVLGARGKDNKGYVLLYKSKDLVDWNLQSTPAGGLEGLGYMWECPDFFTLEEKDVLIISPQGISVKGYLYNNIYQSGYALGSFTENKKNFNYEQFIELDRGFDFYAPQTFKDNKGRRIMIAWMGLTDVTQYSNPTIKNFWQHALTMPRELFIVNEKLIQRPIKEMEELRKNHIAFKTSINGEKVFKELKGEILELKLDVEKLSGDFQLIMRNDCKVIFNEDEQIFELSLGQSGYGRVNRIVKLEKLESIWIFSDTSSIEIFINGGQEVFTTRFYQCEEDEGVKVTCNGIVSINKWDIRT
ncbi:glycoside hydrolase family 32 protein [Clostridium sp. CM028]|uniref:glycoside hydrolase family 32 protein n=1 Tax=unclassified Clostridium TaxID=2614128 RepID=UPI001C6EDBD3|nr:MULTISPECIES: glycoside hydrolase family 32 protein [unclassified Clostridium]MBW9146442.1 glycoside hydrolase family 32 protein [Clostridium sp. CM027]MBW9149167.1 glycoside hydrolase family 32 protein [Clostridium sp. CM028]UVE41947.1 glycoside hydrolase family 32 protein [Clostridium sp. CM027]WLC62572.1 glycoside hydrolase family 32 protein [Clostridium sp. CM028]